eukprot:gnl/MRDRNA2_/MRDRNA2_109278_c0_seq1.p1 gnl/MRDRNA2_/MRDRNA2_109278_c0~~gnl/MRDRNA2_/MRDRNA2_109278_c0_seq1.p1  ORF type:complete len:742 (+),score=135.99 gnl/MRDRNA2_/MRDRNA2_109278_c0_seq1:62-2227(+)
MPPARKTRNTSLCKENVVPLAGIQKNPQGALKASALLNRSPLSDVRNVASSRERPSCQVPLLAEAEGEAACYSQQHVTHSSSYTIPMDVSSSPSSKQLDNSKNRWAAQVDFSISLSFDYTADCNENALSQNEQVQLGLDVEEVQEEVVKKSHICSGSAEQDLKDDHQETTASEQHVSHQKADYDSFISHSNMHSSHLYSFSSTEDQLSEQGSDDQPGMPEDNVQEEGRPPRKSNLAREKRMPFESSSSEDELSQLGVAEQPGVQEDNAQEGVRKCRKSNSGQGKRMPFETGREDLVKQEQKAMEQDNNTLTFNDSLKSTSSSGTDKTGVNHASSSTSETSLSLAHSARCRESLHHECVRKSSACGPLSNNGSLVSAACSVWDCALSPNKRSFSSCSVAKPGRTIASRRDSASIYTRGEAWLERKRQREKELREERARQEIFDCTFCPETHGISGGDVGGRVVQKRSIPITKDQANEFFERNVAWKHKLDERHKSRLKRRLEEDEVQVQALRRSASTQAHPRIAPDVVLTQFYERNIAWQSECEKRISQQYEDSIARQVGHHVFNVGSRPALNQSVVRHGAQKRSSSTGNLEKRKVACDPGKLNAAEIKTKAPISSSAPSCFDAPTRPTFRCVQQIEASTCTDSPESGVQHVSLSSEREEVMNHLQELRDCILSSKCRLKAASSGQQRAQSRRLFCNCPKCNVASLWMVVCNSKARSHVVEA